MYRDTIAICGGLMAALLLSSNAVAQSEANNTSARRDGSARIKFERDDIYDRLAPLVRQATPTAPREEDEEIIDSVAPEFADADEVPLIELQSDGPPSPIEPVVEAPVTDVASHVHELLANKPSHLEPADREFYVTSQLNSFSQDDLRQLVIASAVELEQELVNVHFGDRWLSYLSLRQLRELIGEANDEEQNSTEINPRQQRLHSILQSYDRIARDRQFDAITGRHSFLILRHALAELVTSPAERVERRKAYLSIVTLSESLRPIPTGAQWSEYFKVQRVAQLLSSPRPISRDEKSELQLILSRFEKAAIDPQFKQVANLDGFADTHRRLQLAVAVVPDAESLTLTADEPQASPAAEDANQVHVLSEQGLTFIRQPRQDDWQIVDNSQLLRSETEVKTNETGIARLVIGTNAEAVCAPGTVLRVHQLKITEDQFVTELKIERGSLKLVSRVEPDLSPDALSPEPERLIAVTYGGHRLISRGRELELDVREERKTERVIASVYAGSILVAHGTGDEVTIRVGREAVMLPAGIAIRPAAKKPDAWWPTRGEQPASARNRASGSARR